MHDAVAGDERGRLDRRAAEGRAAVADRDRERLAADEEVGRGERGVGAVDEVVAQRAQAGVGVVADRGEGAGVGGGEVGEGVVGGRDDGEEPAAAERRGEAGGVDEAEEGAKRPSRRRRLDEVDGERRGQAEALGAAGEAGGAGSRRGSRARGARGRGRAGGRGRCGRRARGRGGRRR
ncbi:MAG: hypothetical protein H6705_04140 [Myxococcales bacterium]|nr:hypothetical protein [Myxococcales bacterium]